MFVVGYYYSVSETVFDNPTRMLTMRLWVRGLLLLLFWAAGRRRTAASAHWSTGDGRSNVVFVHVKAIVDDQTRKAITVD